MSASPSVLALALTLPLVLVACGGDDDGAAIDAAPGTDDDGGGDDPDAFTTGCEQVSGTTIALELVTEEVTAPLLVTSPPGDPRLFAIEQEGAIKIIENGAVLATPFLDLSGEVQAGGEQGLLGLAFHPAYSINGRFFVYYTRNNGDNVVAEYHRSDADPDIADPASGAILLPMPDIAPNHNGGMIAFGPDGYLYISTGDGGGGGDPADNGQDVRSLLGKILRIDVDDGDPYGIPADNPLVGSATVGVQEEIWHTGLRNPWRWSFDRGSGDMWIGDVGQSQWEEIDHVAAGQGGKNFGWSDKEGPDCFDEDPCAAPLTTEPAATFTDPVAAYANPQGADTPRAVVGGYVYRGACFPDIDGHYFYADTYTGEMWSIDTAATPLAEVDVQYGDAIPYIVSFGEDASGELYVVSQTNGIYRLTAH